MVNDYSATRSGFSQGFRSQFAFAIYHCFIGNQLRITNCELRIGYHWRMNWKDNILTTDDEIRELLRNTKTIAVLGIKPESHASQPAFYVPEYMANAGYDIIPVPVYYPEVTEILGKKVYRDLNDIPDEIDLLNVFRRPEDIANHTDEILSKKPKAVWFQLGIRNDEVAERLAETGIKVVQDLCLMVEHRALMR